MTLSSNLQKALAEAGISAQVMAFIDLVGLGWKPSDAYVVVGLIDSEKSLPTVLTKMQKTLDNFKVQQYQMSVPQKIAAAFDKLRASGALEKNAEDEADDEDEEEAPPPPPAPEQPKGKFRDKESVISELEALVPDIVDPLEKAGILMKIADLQQMKKEQPKEEERLIKYFLPISCKNCSLYIRAKKKGYNK